jgi:hypothetical protein
MAKRANAQPFLSELCDVLGVPRPDPASGGIGPYRFERNVIHHEADGTTTTRRIDLYRRACFVCETKQGAAPHRQASLQPPSPIKSPRGWKAVPQRWRPIRRQPDKRPCRTVCE